MRHVPLTVPQQKTAFLIGGRVFPKQPCCSSERRRANSSSLIILWSARLGHVICACSSMGVPKVYSNPVFSRFPPMDDFSFTNLSAIFAIAASFDLCRYISSPHFQKRSSISLCKSSANNVLAHANHGLECTSGAEGSKDSCI